MHVRQVQMTPELATTILGNNPRNRLVTPYRITALATALREGRFVPEAAGPVSLGEHFPDVQCFDQAQCVVHRELYDGQHRLAATAESGISWDCIVILDAPEVARLHYDTGKKRSFGDYLRMRGEPNSTALAAATQLLWHYRQGNLATRAAFLSNRHHGADHAQLWEFYQKNRDTLTEGLHVGRVIKDGPMRLVSTSVATVTAAVLSEIDHADCEVYFKHLAMSPDVADTPKIVKVVLRALTNLPTAGTKGVPGDQQHQMALLMKGWNYWRDGEDRDIVVWKLGGRNPENFPAPH